jgi:ATP-dependent RNA helicase DDX52/ROK1
MGDAFALLSAGTTFDSKAQNPIAKRFSTLNGTVSAVKLPSELDFFGDVPKEDQKRILSSELKTPKRPRPEEEDFEPQQLQKRYKIKVTGKNSPPPVASFSDLSKLNAPDYLISNINELGFSIPTPIQMQSIPIILAKRDLLACSTTGSGKTLAYLIPLLIRLKSHRSKGFRAVIITPTRELAQQVRLISPVLIVRLTMSQKNSSKDETLRSVY